MRSNETLQLLCSKLMKFDGPLALIVYLTQSQNLSINTLPYVKEILLSNSPIKMGDAIYKKKER